MNFSFRYSLVFLGWVFAALIVPTYIGKGSLGFVRMYNIALLFFSPFCIIGMLETSKKINTLKSSKNTKIFVIIGVFFFLFLLFNSQFVMEVHREILRGEGYASSISLIQPRCEKGTCTNEELRSLYVSLNSEYDIYSAEWLGKYKVEKTVVSDFTGVLISYGLIPPSERIEYKKSLQPYYDSLKSNSYIYLRKVNLIDGILVGTGYEGWNETSEILPRLEESKNKVYSNSGSVVYK